MKITFIGHVSKDVNITPIGKKIVAGGGVFYGSIAVTALKAEAEVYTKCSVNDIDFFSEMKKSGVKVHFLESPTTTSIENVYTENPDERKSRVISLAFPFHLDEIVKIKEKVVHVNPLWFGEFPEESLKIIRDRTEFLAGDAQGFVRVINNGKMIYKDWEKKVNYLKYFDLFKVDSNESRILSGKKELKEGLIVLKEMGAKIVLGTYSKGVCTYDGKNFYEAKFGEWSLEGRTGRGDTCTAAFMVALDRMNVKSATEFAARITTLKMCSPGPLKKEMLL